MFFVVFNGLSQKLEIIFVPQKTKYTEVKYTQKRVDDSCMNSYVNNIFDMSNIVGRCNIGN